MIQNLFSGVTPIFPSGCRLVAHRQSPQHCWSHISAVYVENRGSYGCPTHLRPSKQNRLPGPQSGGNRGGRELGWGSQSILTYSSRALPRSTPRADATLSVMQAFGLVLLALLPISPLAFSQPTAAPAIQTITLGNSSVLLTGPWKFQPGDSPLANGTPLWAQPAFDDSHWAPMDLTPQADSVDLVLGTSGFVPGCLPSIPHPATEIRVESAREQPNIALRLT